MDLNPEVVAATKLQIWQTLLATREREASHAIYGDSGRREPKPVDVVACANEAEAVFKLLCV